MRTAVLLLAALAALVAAPALAQEAPHATAPAGPSVADQIAEYLRTSPVAEIEDGGVQGVTARDDRKVHGEVSVGVGTHGYRSIYLRSDMPVGETGRLSVAFGDTRGQWRDYRADDLDGRRTVGADLRFGARDARRCDFEAMTPPRPLDTPGGPGGRCARPLP